MYLCVTFSYLSIFVSMCLWLRFSTGDDRAPQSTYDEAMSILAVRTRARSAPDTCGRSSESLTPHPTTHRTDLPSPKELPRPLNIRASKVETCWPRSHAVLTSELCYLRSLHWPGQMPVTHIFCRLSSVGPQSQELNDPLNLPPLRMEMPQKARIKITIWVSSSTTGHIPWKKPLSKT